MRFRAYPGRFQAFKLKAQGEEQDPDVEHQVCLARGPADSAGKPGMTPIAPQLHHLIGKAGPASHTTLQALPGMRGTQHGGLCLRITLIEFRTSKSSEPQAFVKALNPPSHLLTTEGDVST